jgi:hypothetical protein
MSTGLTAALIIPFGDLNYRVDSNQLKRYEPHMSPVTHSAQQSHSLLTQGEILVPPYRAWYQCLEAKT